MSSKIEFLDVLTPSLIALVVVIVTFLILLESRNETKLLEIMINTFLDTRRKKRSRASQNEKLKNGVNLINTS